MRGDGTPMHSASFGEFATGGSTRRATPHCLVLICNRFATGNAARPSLLGIGIAVFVAFPCHYVPRLGTRPALPVGLHWRRDCWVAPSTLLSCRHHLAPLKRSWPVGLGWFLFCRTSLAKLLLALAGTRAMQRPCLFRIGCRIFGRIWAKSVGQIPTACLGIAPSLLTLDSSEGAFSTCCRLVGIGEGEPPRTLPMAA